MVNRDTDGQPLPKQNKGPTPLDEIMNEGPPGAPQGVSLEVSVKKVTKRKYRRKAAPRTARKSGI